ncbi:probable serine/threonine-protein kinase irlF [Anthonomus grandis grandis]|uniref:probable serine/threonine-protein kinase irlF n=1 Tax=Anthonomus grandis grandis TaxID=2921223 RepID=UPI002165362D|nr:probable serine/threonine-protein kinase irlF [Anthonomus grandis grandis]
MSPDEVERTKKVIRNMAQKLEDNEKADKNTNKNEEQNEETKENVDPDIIVDISGKNNLEKNKEEKQQQVNLQQEEARKNKIKKKSPLIPSKKGNENGEARPEEQTPIKDIELEEVVSPFSRHLRFTEPIKKSLENKKKEKLPSAISSQAWRKHIEKQEQEKLNKQEALQKRRGERLEKQSTNIAKKNTSKPVKKNAAKKVKLMCSLCEDELVSDTEDDSLKNVGCDTCPKWYHLACAELSYLPVEEAATKNFICIFCK